MVTGLSDRFLPIHLPLKNEMISMGEASDKIGLVELLDRALSKGIALNADLIITVSEVPLLAANLRLLIASVETMMNYGIMNDRLAPKHLSEKNMAEIPNIDCAQNSERFLARTEIS